MSRMLLEIWGDPLCREESTHERESVGVPRNNYATGCPRATSRLRIGISTRKNYSEVRQHRKISFKLKNAVKPDKLSSLDALRPCAHLFVLSTVVQARFASLDGL